MSEPGTLLGMFHMRLDSTDLHLSGEPVEMASIFVLGFFVYYFMHEISGSVFR